MCVVGVEVEGVFARRKFHRSIKHYVLLSAAGVMKPLVFHFPDASPCLGIHNPTVIRGLILRNNFADGIDTDRRWLADRHPLVNVLILSKAGVLQDDVGKLSWRGEC